MQALATYTDSANSPRFSRAAWLAEILRERIITGIYKPGERIREASLQEEFGFSNGPIREALQLVVADGLLERAPWRGVRVGQLGDKEVVELFQLRAVLIEFAAEQAARRADPVALGRAEEMRRSIGQIFADIRAGKPPSYNTGRLANWILEGAGNTILQRVWDKTMLQARVYVFASFRSKTGHTTEIKVYDLIDAIVAGDVPGARKAARDMTRKVLNDLGLDGEI